MRRGVAELVLAGGLGAGGQKDFGALNHRLRAAITIAVAVQPRAGVHVVDGMVQRRAQGLVDAVHSRDHSLLAALRLYHQLQTCKLGIAFAT